jgi:hypothetical protein
MEALIRRTGYVTYRKSELLLGIEIIVVLEHTIYFIYDALLAKPLFTMG